VYILILLSIDQQSTMRWLLFFILASASRAFDMHPLTRFTKPVWQTQLTPRRVSDDGWGDDAAEATVTTNTPSPQPSPPPLPPPSQERDMFVPIFTLISIAGFSSIYAYETFRVGCFFGNIGGACGVDW